MRWWVAPEEEKIENEHSVTDPDTATVVGIGGLVTCQVISMEEVGQHTKSIRHADAAVVGRVAAVEKRALAHIRNAIRIQITA